MRASSNGSVLGSICAGGRCSLGGSSPGQALLNAMQRAVNAGIVIVISAGNDGTDPTKGANADPFALIPAQQFPGSVIIAGSVGVDNGAGGTDINQISDFSNRAGTGAAYYLMALGYRDRAPDETGAQFLWSGTSFSAAPYSRRAPSLSFFSTARSPAFMWL